MHKKVKWEVASWLKSGDRKRVREETLLKRPFRRKYKKCVTKLEIKISTKTKKHNKKSIVFLEKKNLTFFLFFNPHSRHSQDKGKKLQESIL